MTRLTLILILLWGSMYAETESLDADYLSDRRFTRALADIVQTLELDADFDVGEDGIEQISLAVIDLTGKKPVLAEFNGDNFIYPASVYKMYVAAEILRQVSAGKYGLESQYVVRSPNDVDTAKEIFSDPRPLLSDGDTVTVNYLLDLMITRSDNTAANCLIDLAKRENINQLMKMYGWEGSEVTRKFLSRKFEDPGYEKIRSTETCARHAADFMFLLDRGELVNPWVSQQLKVLLGRQLDRSKLSAGLPPGAMFYHKTGWWSYWTNDVGIVDDGQVRYVISCFLPLEEDLAQPKFEALAKQIHALIQNRNR